jgi:hypothetical protein
MLYQLQSLCSQSQSYFAAASQSVLALTPSGTYDQITPVAKTVAVLFVMGRPPVWEDGYLL